MTIAQDVMTLYKQHVMNTYTPDAVMVRGRGTKLWDANGKVFLDFTSGIAVTNLGHCHPDIVDSIQRQAAKLMHVSNLQYNEKQAILAEKLSNLGFGGKCFFCNSGAEANEAMIKMARAWGADKGRYEIITMTGSFHGRTMACISATEQEKVKKGFDPLLDGFVHAQFNSLESVKAYVTDKTAAVMVESIQGEGGVLPASDEFMRGLRELCDERGILLLCDEVQTGMGRTGSWFGFQGSGVVPDAFSLAKGLGSGFPVGALVAGPRCADAFQPGMHASTFGGNPLACAAAITTIDTIESEDLIGAAGRLGELFGMGLDAFVDTFEHVTMARGRGLMWALVLDQPVKPVVERLADIGLLAIATGENVIRLLPPLTVTEDELEEALDILEDVLDEWHQELADAAEADAPAEDEAAEDEAASDDAADEAVAAHEG